MKQKQPTLFTVLLPVHRNANLLPYAIESVLAQTIGSFNLFIICDGAPSDTIECARIFSEKDSRIKVFVFDKGERHGEAHRHEALIQANSEYVAGIADDDLWLPNHLEELAKLLEECDFGNLMQTDVEPDVGFITHIDDLRNEETVNRMLHANANFFGPTVCGYKLSAYNSLELGWSPAPKSMSTTDLFMWQKFLSTKELKFASRLAITSLHFPSYTRKHMSESERVEEMRYWYAKILSPTERDTLSQTILDKIRSKYNEVFVINKPFFADLKWRKMSVVTPYH